MLRCSDGSFYIGWTDDLDRRLACHNSGRGAKYTRSRRPVELVYHEDFSTASQARKREWAMKRLSRKAKENLLVGDE